MSGTKDKSMRDENMFYLFIWIVAAVLPLLMEGWEYANNSVFHWKPIVRWWTGMIPLLIIFLIHHHLLLPFFLKKGKMLHYGASVCAIMLAFCIFSHYADDRDHLRHKGPQGPPPHHLERLDHHLPMPFNDQLSHMERKPRPESGMKPHGMLPFPVLFRILLALLIIGADTAISLSFSYRREQNDKKDLEKFKLQEELKYLKQQISPHFFMNVMNNIHEMAEEDVSKAQNMILELSHLMRYVLYESENGATELAYEAKFISSYVGLMKMRYLEDIVKVNLELPEDMTRGLRVPPLLFISFIENAFKHGVSYLNETVIDIRLQELDGKVLFNCINTLPLKRKAVDRKGGVGLSNVRRRLDLLYGNDYTLSIDQDDKTYSVTLLIPGI